MKQYFSNSKWLLPHFLLWFHLLWMTSALSAFESRLIESDKFALLDFKHQITHDPLQIMSSWNASMHFCIWTGVTCSPTNGRVIFLDLESQQLAGSIPPSIGNLTSLMGVYLQNNSFHGEIPQEIGRLQQLQDLNLSYNYFGGNIPANLSRCIELRNLFAIYNEFIGHIPDQLSSLSKLERLRLGRNNLTGSIPAWIGNLSSLLDLSLSWNNLQGSIPKELGLISYLEFFQLSGNYLSGTIPSSIYNISSIYFFSIALNQLHGQLPSDVGLTLPKLQYFGGGGNNFTGSIPVSLSNASNLMIVDFAQNGLTGTIPRSFGSLQGLFRLNFEDNRLGDGKIGDLNFLTFLTNCSSLKVLGLDRNHFGGELPNSIGNLSAQLQVLAMGYNLISGNIPVGIGNLVNLILLELDANYLSGSVPGVFGRLRNLEQLYLGFNNFSGSIPSSLGNLTKLIRLFMQENKFDGSIPPSIGNCQKLQTLNFSSNNLNGTIPKQVIGLSSLSISLVMSNNFLTGSIPLEVGNLKNLMELDLSMNRLSSEIPNSLDSCTSLEHLYLGSNTFEGNIPQSLESLSGLEELDLSYNHFSGQIPTFLTKLSLKYLNLSYNRFDGEVPKEGIFANASAISLVGNEVCGGAPKLLLPPCVRKGSRKILNSKVVISIIIVVILVILLSSYFVLYYLVKSSRRLQSTTPSTQRQFGYSYSEIAKSTDNFSKEKLIGMGSFGSVYKGTLSGDHRKIVAIKVLKLQQQKALKSFIVECNVLRSIRHRNILKVLTVCSSVDHEGNDFKCLVFEFMSNGSLDKWLHCTVDEHLLIKKLSLMQRLNIAIDVASAFQYLHHHCETPIVHCDLKPSNILLDEEMVAHVGDFGLARFLYEGLHSPSQNQTISADLRGSIGYIPPEYMGGQVSIFGDIYSYGILLMEMFTDKRPTDDTFKDDLTIHNFVLMAFPNHVMDIVDPSLLFEGENEDDRVEEAMIRNIESEITSERTSLEECLVSVLRIGLMCSNTSPGERMAMNDVVKNLKTIKNSFLRSKDQKRGRKK